MRETRPERWVFTISLLVLLLFVAAPVSVRAQAALTGAVSGTAVDASGGVLVNADVTLKNEASGDVRRAKTNAQGVFVVTGVQPGTYELTVAYVGLRTTQRKGLSVHPGDRVNLSNIELAVSAGGEEITVLASVPGLTPQDTGEKSYTITADQIQNIAVVGRSAAELIKLLPGVIPLTNNNQPGYSGESVGLKTTETANALATNAVQGAYSITGTRPDAIDITVDGAPASDRTRMGNVVNPNIEMTQEFKVLVSNFSAEHARGPVAMVSVSKSGGRDFHGTLYTSLRDYRLNANDWSQNKQKLARPKTKYMYPGFNIGGPLLIPGTGFNKDRDKVFFFLGYEYAYQQIDYFRRGWTYTQEMLNGDFRNAEWLKASKNDNVYTVPAGGFVTVDPVGLNIAKIFPAATVTDQATLATNGGFNFVGNPTRNSNMTQALARLDYSISDNTKLFLRYNRQREKMDQPISVYGTLQEYHIPWPTPMDGNNSSDSLSATLTHVFTPTLTMEAVASYTSYKLRNVAQNPALATKAGVGFPYPIFWDQPTVPNIVGYCSTWWGGREGPSMYNPGGGSVIRTDKTFYTAALAFTKVAGTHTLKVGGNFDTAKDSYFDAWASNGEILLAKVPSGAHDGKETSWANWSATDNILADLISGQISGYGQDYAKNPKAYKGRNIEGFIQDSWKIRSNITLDAGVRVSYLGKWEDVNGIGTGVWYGKAAYDADIAQYGSMYYLPGVRWHKRDASVPLTGIERAMLFASPRFGFAWDTTGKGNTVVRGGIGVFRYMEDAYQMTEMLEGPAEFWNINNGGNARSFAVASNEAQAKAQEAAAAGNHAPKPGDGWGATVWLKDDKGMPVAYNWSFTVQQRLPWSMVFEGSYVGNKQDKLALGAGGGSGAAQMGDINMAYGFAGVKPYANYNYLNIVSHQLYQNYHAGQFSLARQKGPFTFLLSYTFSKNLGFRGYGYGSGAYVGQIMDPDYSKRLAQLRATDYGILGQDRTHTLNLSYNYNLPELKGKPTALRLLVGGWQVSGVSTFFTGQPLQGQGGVSANFGMSGTGVGGVALRPGDMITGFPQNTENQLNFSLYPDLSCDPRKNVPNGYYFNPACFVAPSKDNYGVHLMPAMRGPSYTNHDLSLFKNIPLGGPRKLQIRLSAFNVLNHASTYPMTTNFQLSYNNGVPSNPDFGKIPADENVVVGGQTYKSGANKYGRRVVQVAVKFFF